MDSSTMSKNMLLDLVSLDHIYSDITPNKKEVEVAAASAPLESSLNVCPICKKVLPANINLSFHKMLHPWTEKPYACDHCLYVFMTREELTDHCKINHPSNRSYVCAVCGKVFKNIRTLNKHKPTHALVLPFSCAYCDRGFPEYGYWRQHEVAHKSARFQCEDCEVRFTTFKIFNEHREGESCKTKILGCCEQVFPTRMDYVRHCVECHRFHKKDEHGCEYCGRLYAFRCLLNVHKKNCRLRSGRPIQNNKRVKINPNFVLGMDSNPELEIPASVLVPKLAETEGGIRQVYNCDLCERTFFTKSWLTQHRQKHIDPEYVKFFCPLCNKKFGSYSSLYYHKQRTHLKIRRFKCTYCDKAFFDSQSLRDHITSHTGEQPYGCNYCPRKFRNRSSKIEHHRVHTGERPYPCRYCEQKFKRRDARLSHERRHTGEKPYKCQICHRCFAQDSTWRSHEKKHQPPFSCIFCKKEFTSRDVLLQHKLSHDQNVIEEEPVNETSWSQQPLELTTDTEGNVYIQYQDV